MSEQAMHQPCPQHQRILENVGTWQVACTYFRGPDQAPIETEATEVVEAVGSFWTVSHFATNMMGAPFVGRATMGYDPVREEWVSTWVDSMTPFLFVFKGQGDGEGREIRFRGKGPHPQTGELVDYRTVEQAHGDGTRTFEMFLLGDGGEFQMFRYRYTRAG